jgi:UDP-N-acetylglucosamine enolpyruvyl transferase
MATANLQDMSILAGDPTFGNRVQAALFVYVTVSLPGEAITDATVDLHRRKKQYAQALINSPDFFKARFVNAVASNQIVANEATAGGTLVGMTTAQIATAAAACTDADIENAISNAFLAAISTP